MILLLESKKRLFMLRQVQMLGLYSQAVDTRSDLSEIQKPEDRV